MRSLLAALMLLIASDGYALSIGRTIHHQTETFLTRSGAEIELVLSVRRRGVIDQNGFTTLHGFYKLGSPLPPHNEIESDMVAMFDRVNGLIDQYHVNQVILTVTLDHDDDHWPQYACTFIRDKEWDRECEDFEAYRAKTNDGSTTPLESNQAGGGASDWPTTAHEQSEQP